MDASSQSFIQSVPLSDNDDGTAFHNLAQRKLSAVMQIWCSPHLIQFLFSEPGNVFHSDFPSHAPAGSIQMLSKFTQVPEQSQLSNNNSLPISKFFASSAPTNHTPDSLVKFLFAPAASVNNVLLGYVLGDTIVKDNLSPYTDLTRAGRRVQGRFLFDGHNVIVVLHAFSHGCTGILTCTWTNDGLRKRIFFTVPFAEYSFLQLPQHVCSTLTLNEQRRSTFPIPYSQRSVTPCNASIRIDTHALLRKLQGCFTDRSATRDILSSNSGALASRRSGQMYTEMTIGNASTEAYLKFEFFNQYAKQRRVERLIHHRSCSNSARGTPLCSCSLCDLERSTSTTHSKQTHLSSQFSSCRPLAKEVKNEVEKIMDEMLSSSHAVQGQQVVKQEKQVPLVHQPIVPFQHDNSQSDTTTPPNRMLERMRERSARMARHLREQKLEEKRRRNRVSAAKSNLKKKLRVEGQERELELLKKRMTELLALRERLQRENESLKKRAAGHVC